MTKNIANNDPAMPVKPVKFGLRSIGARLFLAVMAAALVGLSSLGYLFYNELKSVRILQLTSETDTRVRQLDAELLSAKSFLKSLVAATTFLHDSGVRSPEAYEKLALSFMPARPKLITGFGVMQFPRSLVDREWFAPFIFDREWLAPYIKESAFDLGVKLPEYPGFSLVDLWLVDKYPEQQYFKDAVKADRYFWSKPYINEAIHPIPLMTFSGTIRDRQGKLIAVMNGDINIKDLSQTKDSPLYDDGGYYALIAQEGELLSYSPDPTKAAKLENVSSIPALKSAWDWIRQELDKGNTIGYFEFDSTYWVYQKVPSNQWVMLQAIPYGTVIRPALLGAISATILAGFFLALVVWLFIRILNRRFQPILEVCDRTVNSSNSPSIRQDEIGHLSDAFFNMVDRQNSLLEEIQKNNVQLTESNRLKDAFLANMSHELRTPLNAILGMTEALLEGFLGSINNRQQTALATIEGSGRHLLELINDILDVAKIEAGLLELDCAPIAIAPLCISSLAFIQQQAQKKNIQLETKLPSNLPNLCIDERRIRQVLINLLNNACKFTPEGGRVTLEVTCQKQNEEEEKSQKSLLRVTVTDTGIGIAPENIKKLFQSFIQIDSALNRKYEGTGLGLALVKRIVELHGGTVEVISELGVGSCFAINLPINIGEPAIKEQTEQDLSEQSQIGQSQTEGLISPLILLAEDNEANIATFSSYLKAKGYRVLLATDGQQAIDLAKAEHPDLVLMDIQMPVMDGMEAIKLIRLDPNLVNIPIIALTALAMVGDREKCLEAGANEYLTKPIKLKALADTIQNILKNRN